MDALALEFNHDVALQYASGRSPRLIQRVLGDRGHLSNEQAAALLGEVLRRSPAGNNPEKPILPAVGAGMTDR